LESFLIVRNETKGPLSPLSFDLLLELWARGIRQVKEIKEIHKGKEGVKLVLFVDNMILYLKDPKMHPQKNS
jgi:hypothetical protein